MWRRYYAVKLIEFTEKFNYLSNHGKYAIFFTEDNANAGMIAYQKYFRTERHAERAAERLYKREFGQFENIFVDGSNE